MKKYLKILIFILFILLLILFYLNRYEKKIIPFKTQKTYIAIDNLEMTLYGPYQKKDNLNKNAFFGYQKDNIYVSGIKEKKENYLSFEDFIKAKDFDNKKLYNFTSNVEIASRPTNIYHNPKNPSYLLYSTYLETDKHYVEILMWSNKTILGEYKSSIRSIRRKNEKKAD